MQNLFKAYDISRRKPDLTTVHSEDLKKDILYILQKGYDIFDRNIGVEMISSQNQTRKNFLITTSNKKYLLKYTPDLKRKDRIVWEAELARTLNRKNIPLTQSINTTLDKPFISWKNKIYTLYEFEEGEHFCGTAREYKTAAEYFAKLSKFSTQLSKLTKNTLETSFLDELPELIDEILKTEPKSQLGKLCYKHKEILKQTQTDILRNKAEIEKSKIITHLDYHPSNLIVRNHKVVSILDLETVQLYYAQVSSGFASYKLIRHILMRSDSKKRKTLSSKLIKQWQFIWNKNMPDIKLNATQLARGAQYRILFLINLILKRHVKEQNTSSDYDLEKQILSLYEIQEMCYD